MKPPPLSKVPESGTAQTPIQAAASSKHPRSSAQSRMRLAISRWDISARFRQSQAGDTNSESEQWKFRGNCRCDSEKA